VQCAFGGVEYIIYVGKIAKYFFQGALVPEKRSLHGRIVVDGISKIHELLE
jgi:hypothetical protein